MAEVRLGVIGLGNIGLQHLATLRSGEISACRVTAISTRSDHPITGDVDARHFSDYGALIESGLCDAVLVATPTYTHRDIGLRALRQGLHVLMEKPIGLSAHEGEKLIAAAAPGQVFAAMLNQRVDPVYLAMKQTIDNGAIGEIQRTHWTMTNWFRPQIYYQASDWRATWRGEGGGLLVNQCIHNLDIFQWICGMPVRLNAFCKFGEYHDIEVEDEASAYLEYANGATGVFIASTGEAPGFNRFDIVGDRGTLSFDGERLRLLQNEPATSVFSRETKEMFGTPALSASDLTPNERVNQHARLLQNFVDAIRRSGEQCSGEPLIASASDSLASLQLANAMLLSSWRGDLVELPLDASTYHEELGRRIAQSSLREKSAAEVVVDMNKSFR